MAVLESLKDSSILLVTMLSNFASQHLYINQKKKTKIVQQQNARRLKPLTLTSYGWGLGDKSFCQL